ncbi:MAG: cytochrome c oxidase subunit 3 [Isosphaeraceae bacterium]
MADPALAHDSAAATLAPPGHGQGDAHAHHPNLQHHFEDLEQQRDASNLGMWTFLGTEVMFFAGVIGAYLVYRFTSPDVWAACSGHLNMPLATLNTVVLLTSSLTMALAVHAGELGVKRDQIRYLIATMVLGSLFLVFKGYEYYEEYEAGLIPGANFNVASLHLPTTLDPAELSTEERAEVAVTTRSASVLTVSPAEFAGRRAKLFFTFYFVMTGLHAIHMIVGLVMLGCILTLARRGRFTPSYHNPLEVAGLYWHFIDIVWVFLFPLLYLVALHK